TIVNPCVFCLDEQQRPRRLPCGHTFCTVCLVRYLQVRDDPRCPLCRRVFQVSAGDLDEASNDSTIDPVSAPYVVAAVMERPGPEPVSSSPSTPAESFISANEMRSSDLHVHVFDIDLDMRNDTLVLTLTEQEVRLFAELYDEVVRDTDPRQT
ncbi:hypothetical protein KR222_001953, partial [Zaprionus bogoriensis]